MECKEDDCAAAIAAFRRDSGNGGIRQHEFER
jgi:hypothetical protein